MLVFGGLVARSVIERLFFGIIEALSKRLSFWTQTCSGSISRNPRTPHQLHLHAFTQPIMQRKNYALKGNKNGGKKGIMIIYFVALSKSWERQGRERESLMPWHVME